MPHSQSGAEKAARGKKEDDVNDRRRPVNEETTMDQTKHIVWFSDEDSSQVAQLGGKNISLVEMTKKMHEQGILVPIPFAERQG